MSWIRGPTQVVWRRRLNNNDDNVTGRSAALLSHEDESWQCAEAASVAHKSIAELWDSIKQSVDAAGIDALEKRADVANRQRQAAEDSLLSSTRTAAADVLTWMRRPTSQRDSGQERRAVVALRDRPAVSCWCGRPPSPAPHHTFHFSLFLPKPRGAEDEEADRHEHLPALCRHVRGFAVARWRGASWLPWDAWIAAACEAARVPLLLPPAAQALCWMAVSAHRSGFKKRFYWNSQTGGECAYDAEVGRDGVRDFPFAIADAAVEAKKLWQTSEAPSSLPPPPCCAVRWNRADAHRDTVSFEENTRLHALAEVRQHRFWEVPTVAGASFRKGISRPTAPRRTRRKRARSEERMEADCAADDDDDDADSEDAAVPQRTHTMYHHLSAELLSNSDGDTVAVHRCRDGAVAAGGDTPGRLRASAQETQQTQSTMPDAATSLPLQDGKAACNLAGAFPGSRASPTSVLVCLPVLGADPLSMSECRADRSRTSDTSEKEEGEKAFSAFPTFAVVREAAAAAAAKAQQRRHTRDRQALMSSLLRRSPLPTSAQCAIHTRSMSCLRRSNAEWTWQLPLARVEARCREYWRPPSKIPAGAIHSMEPVGTDGDRAGEVRASCGRQRKSTTSPAPCSPTAALPFDLLRAFVVPSPFMAAAVLGISASSRSQRRTGRVEGADARLITAGAPRVTPVVSACNHDGEGVVEPQTDAPLLLAMKRSAPLTPSQERHQARHALLMSAATDDGERISLRIPIAPTRKAAFNVRGAEAVHSFCTAHWPLLTLRNVAAAQLRQPRQAPLPDIAASAAAASADSAAAVLLTGAPNECHVDQHARVASQSVPSSPVVQIQARRRVRCRALRRAFYRHILTASTPASSQLLTAPSEDVDDPLRAPSSTWQRYRRELARGDDAELDRCVRSVLAYAQAEMCGGAFSSFYLKLTVFDADGNRNIDSNHDNAAAAVATVGGEGSVRAIQVKHHHMTSRGARLCSGSHPALSPPPCVDLCVRDINCTPSYYQRLMHTLLVDGLRRDGWLLFHTHWHDALAGCQALLSSHPSRPGGAGELLRGDTAAPTHPPFMGSVTATVDSYGHSSDACDCAASREVRWFVDSEDDDETAGNTADVGAAQLEAGLHGAQETIWSSRSEAENAERPFPILNWSGVPDDQEAAIFMTRAAAAQAAAKSARFLFFYAAGTPYNMERTSPSDIYDTAGESDTAVSVSASSSSASSNPVNGHDGSRSTTCAARAQARGDAGGGAENLHGQLRRHAAQLLAGTFPCAEGVHCANDTLPPRTSLPAATHAVECEVQPLRRRRYTRRVFSFHEEQRFLLAEARVAWETRQSARRHSRRSSTEDEFDGAGNSTAATTAVTKSSAPPSTTLLSSVFSEGDALDTAEGEEEEGELAWLRLRHRAHLRHVRTPAGPLWPHREVPHDVFSEACRSDAATHFTYMAYMLRDRRRTLGAAASARPF
ncbi:hypothetical protein ABB37_10035 [Leptomonas pyrrhocoris]|uniref:Uncharacterized protein n=1 Tax=Leptomonas pyrrhocoris TaxID=157538 RepID=A0A0M9FPE2_LEPPY|nr:hypothetical protein ABB37_10035 [Leptomonas pyrrhocoris]KPA73209.1 hypothetical protein ABB37_10035 [Leptomonas pyrrhocoris]|eukprot:XP_015651648.1 hypothetical protein ABB37_10035 [Leptomonas pyrrhocoris]